MPVAGAEFILHEKNGEVVYANGSHFNLSHMANVLPTLDENQALEATSDAWGVSEEAEETEPQITLTITGKLANLEVGPTLAYEVIRNKTGESMTFYVDAKTGDLLSSKDNMRHAIPMTANTLYDGGKTIQGTYNSVKGWYRDKSGKNLLVRWKYLRCKTTRPQI